VIKVPKDCRQHSFLNQVKQQKSSRVPVAQTCDPQYSGDQKDHGSKPAQSNSSQDPISKKPSQKRADGVAQGVGPEFKPQYCKNK
jgi:hypothetical protein